MDPVNFIFSRRMGARHHNCQFQLTILETVTIIIVCATVSILKTMQSIALMNAPGCPIQPALPGVVQGKVDKR